MAAGLGRGSAGTDPPKQFKIIIDCTGEAYQAELIEEFAGRELKFTAPSM